MARLAKRDIPAVIMEPLLGGRLANVPDPIQQKLKQYRPEESVASWAFRFAGTPEKRADCAFGHDVYGSSAG